MNQIKDMLIDTISKTEFGKKLIDTVNGILKPIEDNIINPIKGAIEGVYVGIRNMLPEPIANLMPAVETQAARPSAPETRPTPTQPTPAAQEPVSPPTTPNTPKPQPAQQKGA